VSSDPEAAVTAVDEQAADLPDLAPEPPETARGWSLRRKLTVLVPLAVVVNAIAFFVLPPYPLGHPGEPVTGIADLIGANLELPAPHVVLPPGTHAPPGQIVFWQVSITSSLFTMWVVGIVVLALAVLFTRDLRLVPKGGQNLFEFAFESLENWAMSLGGPGARRHIPVFAALFLFILFCNWSGLLPFFGRIEWFRAPTSDVNVTLGLALFAFVYFHYQGFSALGVRGYLGKFFVFGGFKEGLAAGLIAVFVGLIEFLLEFIKPITLAMRLFGNIYGGEVALGVITALTIAFIPIALYSLEVLLNLIQALIFATLTLMYTIIAMEGHEEEAHVAPAYADLPEGNLGPPMDLQPAGH
jgi:F-type H+-transporting ATPase subunit a